MIYAMIYKDRLYRNDRKTDTFLYIYSTGNIWVIETCGPMQTIKSTIVNHL